MEWGCSLSWLRSVVNDNTLGLYAGDTWLESLLGYQVSCVRFDQSPGS
jgi:hypothetical protein